MFVCMRKLDGGKWGEERAYHVPRLLQHSPYKDPLQVYPKGGPQDPSGVMGEEEGGGGGGGQLD